MSDNPSAFGDGLSADKPLNNGLFNDGKAADALRTIGEVAKALGIRQHVLRYWEEQFPVLQPLKRSGGRRYYRPDDIALIQAIDRLVHREGYTLRGARAALAGRGGADAAPAATLPIMESPVPGTMPTAIRARLIALRHSLAAALQEA